MVTFHLIAIVYIIYQVSQPLPLPFPYIMSLGGLYPNAGFKSQTSDYMGLFPNNIYLKK